MTGLVNVDCGDVAVATSSLMSAEKLTHCELIDDVRRDTS